MLTFGSQSIFGIDLSLPEVFTGLMAHGGTLADTMVLFATLLLTEEVSGYVSTCPRFRTKPNHNIAISW
jgi:hypothetical protein